MKRILIVGCGDVARRLAPLLTSKCRVYGLVRTPQHKAALRQLGMVPLEGDLDRPDTLQRLAGLADTVVHLAPPAQTNSGGDSRTRHLLAALAHGVLPRRLVYVSTSGVYGDCAGAWIDETRTPHPQNTRAQRRVDAERQLRVWGQDNGVSVAILRVPGIYAGDRLPLERIRAGTPAIVTAEDGYTNHIHADDLARVVAAAMRHGKPNRVYHACDDSELKMGDYFDMVADAYALPRPPRLLRSEVQRAVSPALWSFMNESRRLSNRRMKQELHVRLRYPHVRDALVK